MKEFISGRYTTVQLIKLCGDDTTFVLKRVCKKNTDDTSNEVLIHKHIGNQEKNLVPLLHSSDTECFSYLNLPYYSGGDLYSLVSNKKFSIERIPKMIHDVLTGLFILHSKGVVHRDISLENIFYDQKKDIFMIGDFGVSKIIANEPLNEKEKDSAAAAVGAAADTDIDTGAGTFSHKHLREICGKAIYRAPELLIQSNEFVDYFACDIWAFAVLLYACLTHTFPFLQAHEDDPGFMKVKNGKLKELLEECVALDANLPITNKIFVKYFQIVENIFKCIDNPEDRPTPGMLLCEINDL